MPEVKNGNECHIEDMETEASIAILSIDNSHSRFINSSVLNVTEVNQDTFHVSNDKQFADPNDEQELFMKNNKEAQYIGSNFSNIIEMKTLRGEKPKMFYVVDNEDGTCTVIDRDKVDTIPIIDPIDNNNYLSQASAYCTTQKVETNIQQKHQQQYSTEILTSSKHEDNLRVDQVTHCSIKNICQVDPIKSIQTATIASKDGQCDYNTTYVARNVFTSGSREIYQANGWNNLLLKNTQSSGSCEIKSRDSNTNRRTHVPFKHNIPVIETGDVSAHSSQFRHHCHPYLYDETDMPYLIYPRHRYWDDYYPKGVRETGDIPHNCGHSIYDSCSENIHPCSINDYYCPSYPVSPYSSNAWPQRPPRMTHSVRRGHGKGRDGVRQYLQHRLLWARYTGRSQQALNRALTIINNHLEANEAINPAIHSDTWTKQHCHCNKDETLTAVSESYFDIQNSNSPKEMKRQRRQKKKSKQFPSNSSSTIPDETMMATEKITQVMSEDVDNNQIAVKSKCNASTTAGCKSDALKVKVVGLTASHNDGHLTETGGGSNIKFGDVVRRQNRGPGIDNPSIRSTSFIRNTTCDSRDEMLMDVSANRQVPNKQRIAVSTEAAQQTTPTFQSEVLPNNRDCEEKKHHQLEQTSIQSAQYCGATASYSQWSDGQDQDKGKPHVAQHMTAPYRYPYKYHPNAMSYYGEPCSHTVDEYFHNGCCQDWHNNSLPQLTNDHNDVHWFRDHQPTCQCCQPFYTLPEELSTLHHPPMSPMIRDPSNCSHTDKTMCSNTSTNPPDKCNSHKTATGLLEGINIERDPITCVPFKPWVAVREAQELLLSPDIISL